MDATRRELLRVTIGACLAASIPAAGRATIASASRRYPVVCGLDTSTLTERYLSMLTAGGVTCWHKSTGSIRAIGELLDFADRHPKQVTITRTVAEIDTAFADGKLAVVMGTQSAFSVEHALGGEGGVRFSSPAAEERATHALRYELRGYHELGLRIMGIAYNVPNSFGSGGLLPYLGLTPAGRRLVEEIHKLGILLDVGGHTGERTSLDAIAIAPDVPVICSHANAAALVDNPRNISDRLMDAIARTGGVIGVSAVNDFHVRGRGALATAQAPRKTLDDMIDHLDHMKRRVGTDHIGLGPDFVEGRALDWETSGRTIELSRMVLSDGPTVYVKGFETIAQLPDVLDRLGRRGWSAADVEKIAGRNWLRVYRKAWGA